MRICYQFISVIFCILLTACGDTENYAPVADISYVEPIPSSGMHRVTRGETLYEIAWRYGMDYRYLVQRNQTKASEAVHSGQIIQLRGNASRSTLVKQEKESTPSQVSAVEPNDPTSQWMWPAKGKLIGSYSASHKGINIAGAEGEPVYASAAGKVVYCGDGLRSYGNLIIIKHNSLYLSAYAHNKLTLVHEGEWVRKGQKIAEMGDTGTNKVMLHFEIRHAGKSVNPLTLLNS